MLKDCESITNNYLIDLAACKKWLKIAALNEEEQIQKFQLKQRFIRVHIGKVDIGKDRKIEVTISLKLLEIIAL